MSQQCFHCGEPIPKGFSAQLEIKGQHESFCCYGCQAVAELILNDGLENFYQHRTALASKPKELEADEIGLVLMAQAGYDPREAVRFWERFSQAGGKAPPEFLSTHPNSSKRAEKLRAMLPQAMEIYQRAPRKIGLGNNF